MPVPAGAVTLFACVVRLPFVSDQNSKNRESFECFVNVTFE